MASKFSLEATLSLVDDITRPYKKTTNKIVGLNDRLGNSFRSLGTGITRSLKMGAAVGVAALGAGLVVATREFIKFDDSIIGATSRFKDLEVGTEESKEAMEALGRTARDVASISQFTAVQAAEGLNFFAKAGFTSTEAIQALQTQVDLATVAELDLARTSDITSDLLSSLGLNAEDSAVKIKNLADLSNSLGLASNMANVTLEDMFETLKVAGPIATEAGEDMNELIAITSALGGAGIKGSMAATALKNAYIRLAAPTDKVTAALTELGLKQSDFVGQDGDMKSMVNIMQQLGDASKDIGGAKRLALFSEIFGKNAVAGATNMSKSLSEIETIFDALESKRTIKDIADQIRTGLGMQISILKSSLIETGFTFVEVFKDKAAGTIGRLTEIVKGIDLSSLAIRFDSFINRVIDNMPAIKQAFLDILPQIKEVASQMASILGFLVEGIAKITAFTAGPVFTAIDFLLPGGQMRVAERKLAAKKAEEEAERERVSSQNPRYLDQQTAIQQSRIFEEKTQRMDLFFNMPNNSSVSDVPGGAPVNSLQLGLQ